MGDRLRPETTSQKPFDPASSPSAWDHSTTEEARNLLGLGLARPELQDEIFVQLICQLSENPSAISLYRGWQFMQVLLITFPPSPSLEPALRRFLVEKKASAPKTRLGIIARYALMKLDAIIVKGPKGKVPTLFEIAAASEGAFQPSVFGETLQRVMSLQSEAYPDAKIPIILPFLTDVSCSLFRLPYSRQKHISNLATVCSFFFTSQGILALGGLRTSGIFRIPGDLDRVNELKIVIDKGRYSLSGQEDPSIAASLLKLWLRELAQPLIPDHLYGECIASASDPAA